MKALAHAGPRLARHQRVFLPLLAALVALAWASLWAWSLSPYGRLLAHEDWSASGPAAALCRALPGGALLLPLLSPLLSPLLLPLLFTALAWVLMTAAMMLPTTLPLFDLVARLTSARADRGGLLALLGLGYLSAWGVFGMLAHGLHGALLALLARAPALAWHGWIISALLFASAGAFQFSRLKYVCLRRCRAPLGFVMAHWHGRAPGREAFVLGLHHGVFCVGCCWALMLLMFALGAGSLGWMLLLAALMAIEKNMPGGRRLSKPLGLALLAGAALLVLRHA